MDRIVLAYGQVRSAAFLRGQEVRQFTEAGIPILDELAKQFTELEGRAVSTGEVFDKISARLVPFEMVAKVFKDMTAEGGKFYQMQEVQAETLRGKISNLKDAYEVMLNEIGSQKSGEIKGIVESIRNLMQNWELVANAIRTVVYTLGAYHASMLLISGGKWIATFAQTISQWKKLNEVLKFMNLNTIKFSEAMKAAGVSMKMMTSAGLAALTALVVIIANAIKKANALRKELESIMSSELSGSDKMVNDLEILVKRLESATQGSQEYREAISELNRKYGEYLPKIFSEADAFIKVKEAADAAAEAIRNKARATAFDKGTTAIEEKYGKGLTELSKGVENALLFIDPSIPKKAAIDFVKKFREQITLEGEGEGFYSTFETLYKEYFKTDNLPSLLESANGKLAGYSDSLESLVGRYGEMIGLMATEQKALDDELELRFGNAQYDSFEEMRKMAEIEEWYRNELELKDDSLKKLAMSQKEYNEAVEKLNIKKLQKQIHVYDILRRPDKANALRDQLMALTKIPEGWRGTVQSVLKKMGLTKDFSFGLWAEDTTQSTQYVEDMVKRYKEINEQIKLVSPFDKEQTDRLKQNKTAIETIAKALKIDIKELAASKSDKAESKEEKRIKRLVEALRTLQDQYEKLKALGASDESIKSLFKGLYPELIAENGEEFVTDLNYLERAVGLLEELKAIAPDDAKKLLVSIGKDEFSTFLKNLQDKNKSYKDVAKSAEEYFNILRKWGAEDFNLEGEGIAFDIDKISTNLASKIGEVNLKVEKTRELFNQIGISDTSKRSEEDIKKIKEIFEKEFGEGSWDKFYQEFLSKGEAAFTTLADKEIAYEKKIAQEKINALASSYVSDATEGLDLSHWGDKSLGQIEYIREKLRNLMTSDIPISDSLKEELKLLGLSTDDLIAKIKELFGGKFDIATIEKIKEIQEIAKGVTSYAKQAGESLYELGDAMGSDVLKGISKAVSMIGKMADSIMESESLMAKLTLAFGDVSNLSEDAVNNLKALAESKDWITMVVKVILMALTAVSDITAKIRENEELGVKAAIDYQKAQADIARGKSDTIFGTSQISLLVTNLETASQAARDFREEMEKTLSADRGIGKWYLPSIGGEGGELYEMETIRDLKTLLEGIDFSSEIEMMEYLKANIDYWEGLSHLSDGIRTTSQLESEIRNLIKYYDAWNEAQKEVKSSMTELFGQLGSDIASNMINSFIEIGNATANLEESFESLGQTIVQSFLQTAVIDDVLMPRLEEISEIMTGAVTGGLSLEDFSGELGAIVGTIKGDIEDIRPYWEEILSSFAENGLLPDTEGNAAANLGEGIKGITEDTANLLASYLNAIRSDVSYAKTLWTRMDGNLQRITDMFASSPTLMEYQAQIAANTFNTAQATQSILSELRSVMTTDGGDTAIRIYS